MQTYRSMGMLMLCVLSSSLCRCAAGQGSKTSLESDIRELYNGSPKTRLQATSRLIEAGPVAIPPLLSVVCDKSQPQFDAAWPAAAKALGDLKAEAAAQCLVQMLAYNSEAVGIFKPDKTLVELDPAFAALVEIGGPVVPTVRRYIHALRYDQAYLALRVLRVINTPSARQAAEEYVQALSDQIRHSKEVIEEFKYGPGLTR